MDKKEFRTRLAEYVEFEELVPKILREEAGQYDQTHELKIDGELIEIDRTFNPTLGIRLTKLKPRLESCELGCGKIIDRQVIERMYYQTPIPHWRTKCRNCSKYQHPNGVDIIEAKHNISNEFNKHLRHEKFLKEAASRPRR